MVNKPDEDLIEACKKQDRAAQQQLFERYSYKMMAICIRYSDTRQDAEDLLQDGFIKVFAKIGSFKRNSSLSTWMSRVFINMAINRLNRDKRRFKETSLEDEYVNYDDNDIDLPKNVDGQEVLNAMKELPDKYEVVLSLYAIDGMNHREIANLLGISEGGSKSRLSRARNLLRDMLKDKGIIE